MYRYFLFFFPFILQAQVELTESNLPILVVETNGQSIPDEPKINVALRVYDQVNGVSSVNNQPHLIVDPMGIEIRGQSSQWFPKKGYGIELRDEFGEDKDYSLLGLPEESDFVLHGPFSDKSLLRNALTYLLGGQIMEWAPRWRYCELIINDEYQGIYLLTERIKRDKNRVDISKLTPDEAEEPDIEGGYILRFDKHDSPEEILWESPFASEPGYPYKANFIGFYPKVDEITTAQKKYIRNYITDFEKALHDPSYHYEGKRYDEYIDVMSFIDFILMNELTRNVDGYRISSYMHKDKEDVLKMGPLWDFNLAFGNADYCDGGYTYGWEWNFNDICINDAWTNHFWWKRLINDSVFNKMMYERWSDLRQNILSKERIFEQIDSIVLLIDEGVDRNFEQWNILGTYVWPNLFVGNSHEEEIEYIKGWIDERLLFIDNFLPGKEDETQVGEEQAPLFQIYPNPSEGLINFDLSHYAQQAESLVIYNSYGSVAWQQKINDQLFHEYSLDLPSGVYYYVLISPQGKRVNEVQELIII